MSWSHIEAVLPHALDIPIFRKLKGEPAKSLD